MYAQTTLDNPEYVSLGLASLMPSGNGICTVALSTGKYSALEVSQSDVNSIQMHSYTTSSQSEGHRQQSKYLSLVLFKLPNYFNLSVRQILHSSSGIQSDAPRHRDIPQVLQR